MESSSRKLAALVTGAGVLLVVVVAAVALAERCADAPGPRADSQLRVSPAKKPLKRSTVDRPDDVTAPQVHAVYVVAADGRDRRLDVNGTLETVIWRSQDWLAGAADGLSLRLDTYHGRPDITFFRSERRHGWLLDRRLYIVEAIREELWRAGFSDTSKKILLVFYDGRMRDADDLLCGVQDRNVAMVTVADERCGRLHDGWGFEHRDKTIPHETFHATGTVLASGPRADGSGHSTDLRDVMYGHSLPAHRVEALQVDPGHDDYWDDVLPWLTRNHHRLDVAVRGSGAFLADPWPNRHLGSTGSCGDDCVLWYRRGTRVTVRAARNDRSYRFAGWEGACRGAGSCVLTPDAARRLTARFVKVANLDVRVRGPGVVRVSDRGTCRSQWCGYDYRPRSRATVVAVPRSRARFVRWSSHCGRQRRCTVTVDHRRGVTLTAVFRRR